MCKQAFGQFHAVLALEGRRISNVPGFQVSIAPVARATAKKQYGGLRIRAFYEIRVSTFMKSTMGTKVDV